MNKMKVRVNKYSSLIIILFPISLEHPSQEKNILFQDLVNWIQGKEEVEIVDLILRLREKLVRHSSR